MSIQVLYFAALRELLGFAEERLALPEQGLSVEQLLAELERRHPQLGPHRSSLRVAVNETFVAGEAAVREGDTVALIPPVSGG